MADDFIRIRITLRYACELWTGAINGFIVTPSSSSMSTALEDSMGYLIRTGAEMSALGPEALASYEIDIASSFSNANWGHKLQVEIPDEVRLKFPSNYILDVAIHSYLPPDERNGK